MNIDLDVTKILDEYLRRVIDVNTTINLTRIDSFESGKLLHLEDSLAGLPELLSAPNGDVLDLGSGGGFPGVPLALVSGRHIDLLDSVSKKMIAIQGILDKLHIGNVRTIAKRSEELALESPERYSVILARAVTSLSSLCELASPLLQKQGQLIAYKAKDYQSDLELVLPILDKLGMEYSSKRELILSDNETHRCILVFTKISDPLVSLPRRPGIAQKRPYKAK